MLSAVLILHSKYHLKNRSVQAFVLFCLFFMPACIRPEGPVLQVKEIQSLNHTHHQTPYRIGPGDKIAIKFYYNTALNDEVVVRPDGKISLQLIDEVQVEGLSSAKLDEILTNAYADALKTSSREYVLAVGDKLSIRSYYHEKLNDNVVVRPDGKIALQLIDEVQAAGMTPAELDNIITEKYSDFFDSPDLSINVLNFHLPDLSVIVNFSANHKIFVGGEVNHPGIITSPGNIRTLDAIIQSAGIRDSGDLSRVILIRRGPADEPLTYTVNVNNILLGQTPDIWLSPFDILYVPRTEIADLEHYLRTYLWDLLPHQVAFSFIYNWNNEVQVAK